MSARPTQPVKSFSSYQFDFERSRGIIWGCDLVQSSRYLNDDQAVDALETFLPRLHWIALIVVGAAGGQFVKWTGDGFLAWFASPLHRDVGKHTARVFEAAWHLTFLVNVTQLSVQSDSKFQIRHGVTCEHDALLTQITHQGKFVTLDVMGRAVTLACRLASVTAPFPSITTQFDLVKACTGQCQGVKFEAWLPTREDRLKYFKGESWGTDSLCWSTKDNPSSLDVKELKERVTSAIERAEKGPAVEDESLNFALQLHRSMCAGPDWTRKVADEHIRFIGKALLGNLKKLAPLLDSVEE